MKEKALSMKEKAAEASENRSRQRDLRAAEKQVELAAAERTAQRARSVRATGPSAGVGTSPAGRSSTASPAATNAGANATATTVTAAAAKTTGKTTAASGPRTRKARLRLSRIDPWSVMKTAFLLAIAFGIVTWVAVFIVWSAIGAAGVFENINRTVQEVLGTPGAEPFRVQDYVDTNKVMGFTTLLACADVLILTALATLGAFLYNLAAALLGGLEVTLASED